MSASNFNFVCFKCRTSIRRPKALDRAPHCLTCGSECFCLGYKVEIPKHANAKAWLDLEKECQRRAQAFAQSRLLKRVERQHFLEREIRRLAGMPTNRDRNRQIKKLQEELSALPGFPSTPSVPSPAGNRK